jgi:hypothetical protein
MMSAIPSKPTLGATLALLAVALIAPTVAVRVQDKAADRSDELLDYARDSIWRSAKNAFALSRAARYEPPVLARVSSDAHGTKKLVGTTLELDMRDDGSASLRGTGFSKVSKGRAVLQAADTAG